MGFFYKDKPMFGFDIGRSSIKLMQIEQKNKQSVVVGYGTATFDMTAVKDGVIVNPEEIIKTAHELIEKHIVGKLTTRRVAVSLPNAFSFSRVINLPKMSHSDLSSAVQLEVDQSIPLGIDELYYDYSIAQVLEDGGFEVQIVACPRDIIDSYLVVFEALGLEVALVESNISAVTRIVVHAEAHDVSTLIVDIGSTACDLSIYDGSAIRATGTVDCSGERITQHIADALGVSLQQAHSIKTRYGLELSKKQEKIIKAVEPELNKLVNEIRKVMRYFADRDSKGNPIGQIIILGGGANLPGLSTHITDRTRVPTRLCAPWNNISFDKLQPPHELETTLYTTASGLSMIRPEDLVK
ncbi:MAG: type IV pilus assembly protein PilM [Candidatus Saccharibacteria bacterium]|nr:type IV pilus assembly protein PilM [Candidatus Saccharibacteria bacterium]